MEAEVLLNKGSKVIKAITPIYHQESLKISDLRIGGIVNYKSNIATYDGFIPSNEAPTWKVFSTDNGELKIISAESLGDLTLTGKSDYFNLVAILNSLAEQYKDGKYAVKARNVGSTDEVIDYWTPGDPIIEGKSIGRIYGSTLTYDTSEFPYTDYTAQSDLDIILNNPALHHSETDLMWIASRGAVNVFDINFFTARSLFPNGMDHHITLYNIEPDGSEEESSNTYGVRVIITLDPNVKITGNGTAIAPYELSF